MSKRIYLVLASAAACTLLGLGFKAGYELLEISKYQAYATKQARSNIQDEGYDAARFQSIRDKPAHLANTTVMCESVGKAPLVAHLENARDRWPAPDADESSPAGPLATSKHNNSVMFVASPRSGGVTVTKNPVMTSPHIADDVGPEHKPKDHSSPVNPFAVTKCGLLASDGQSWQAVAYRAMKRISNPSEPLKFNLLGGGEATFTRGPEVKGAVDYIATAAPEQVDAIANSVLLESAWTPEASAWVYGKLVLRTPTTSAWLGYIEYKFDNGEGLWVTYRKLSPQAPLLLTARLTQKADGIVLSSTNN